MSNIIIKRPKEIFELFSSLGNLSGVGDVLCFHTADFDWKLSEKDNQFGNWPYDEDIAMHFTQPLMKNMCDVVQKIEMIIAVYEVGI